MSDLSLSSKWYVCITLAIYSVMFVIVYAIAYGILYIMCIIRVFHYLFVFYTFTLLFSIYLVIFLCISCRSTIENSHLFTGKVQKNGICEVLYRIAGNFDGGKF